jgi:flavin reductase (DIM6/NTAB) family NADH-FMN oxidoreductase RutF
MSTSIVVQTHTIVIGKVRDMTLIRDRVEPLVYLDGNFETVHAA